MKLLKVLNLTNSLEKNSFYKILEGIIESVENEEVEEILNNNNRQIKSIDNENIANVFELVKNQYKKKLISEIENSVSNLDVLIDVIIKDGNCIMSREWFSKLYENQINQVKQKSENFIKTIYSESKDLEASRKRDYKIYRNCVEVAYHNDELNNLDKKITHDEHSILRKLAKSLGLSTESQRLINYSILPLEKQDIESVIKGLKDLGIIFYSKKNFELYIPDEIVKMLREINGREVADKYFRRVLKLLKDSQLNNISKINGIDRKLERNEKIKAFINEGLSFTSVLSEQIFKEDVLITDRKKEINSIMELLDITPKGVTLEDKIEVIIQHFDQLEEDERVGISVDGYEHLLNDLKLYLPEVNELLRNEFELQQKEVLSSELLLDYNIKPRDILDLIEKEQLYSFCDNVGIKTRGNTVLNLLEKYTDSENLLLENFIHIGNRDIQELKNNGIELKSADFGLKYEEITRKMFEELGFNVDEELRAEINSKKDKMDIILNLGKDELIIVECKTSKSKEFNKFSAVSRQIKSYHDVGTKNGYRIVKTLLVAPDFSEEFIYDCELEYELNLSLISSKVLFNIWQGFKLAKHKTFPYNLLMRDVLIDDDKILKALKVK